MFVGRKKELDALNSRYTSNRKEFGVLYGRRRIGKSSILNEFLIFKILTPVKIFSLRSFR